MTQHINLPNCIVAQSGGPTVAINASLVGESLAEAANSIWSLAKMRFDQWYSRYSEPALLKSYGAGGFRQRHITAACNYTGHVSGLVPLQIKGLP